VGIIDDIASGDSEVLLEYLRQFSADDPNQGHSMELATTISYRWLQECMQAPLDSGALLALRNGVGPYAAEFLDSIEQLDWPEAEKYVSTLASQMLPRAKGESWNVVIEDADSFNAHALSDLETLVISDTVIDSLNSGKIGIDVFKAVVAHELSHFFYEDHVDAFRLYQIVNQAPQSPLYQYMEGGLDHAVQAFSREGEIRSDLLAVELLRRTEVENPVKAVIDMLEFLGGDEFNNENTYSISERTHPLASERIRFLRSYEERLKEFGLN